MYENKIIYPDGGVLVLLRQGFRPVGRYRPVQFGARYHQYRQTDSTNVHYGKQCNEQFQGNAEDFPAGKRILRCPEKVHDIVKGGKKVQKSILMVAEISEIYVTNFQKMMSDKNYTPQELTAISFGYAKLLEESADVLQDLKNVVNISGMSMTDAERLALIDRAYTSLLNYRNLVNYYTRKIFPFPTCGLKRRTIQTG